MESKELLPKEAEIVATKLNCSTDYVYKVLSGKRNHNTDLAKNIKKAVAIIVYERQKVSEKIEKLKKH